MRRFVTIRRTRLHVAALAFCFVLTSLFSSYAQAQMADATPFLQRTPQATLTEFYQWYLEALAKNRVPLSDDRAKLASFVARPLLQDIERRMKSPDGLDEDYFTKAQDYFDDWAGNVVVSDVRTGGQIASAIVTLGNTPESRQRLALQLVSEDHAWKISRVSEASAHTR